MIRWLINDARWRLEDEEIEKLIEESEKTDFGKVAVVFGGKSEEAEISRKTGKSVLKALHKQGIDAYPFDLAEKNPAELSNFDRAFLCLHGRLGEDGTFQGFCEILGVPYTSEDTVASAICMHKPTSKSIFEKFLIPTPKWFSFSKESWKKEKGSILREIKRMLPCVVKPAFSGSSIGVSLVESEGDVVSSVEWALRFGSEVMVEKYVEGIELTVGVLFGKVLGTLQIKPADDFFSFRAKYEGETQYIIPPEVEVEEVERLAFLCAGSVGATRSAVRVDLIYCVRERKPYFLEVNTIPGMTERSLLPKIAKWRGIEFEDLVRIILSRASLKGLSR